MLNIENVAEFLIKLDKSFYPTPSGSKPEASKYSDV
jgi:hypothetical protein